MLKALLAMLMIGSGSARADTLRVTDGDGFRIGGQEYRIWGIDAPELTQECVDRAGRSYPCGEHAKRALGQILADSAPICDTITRDRFGREVVKCTVRGDDLGGLLVRAGWAVDFERFSGGRYRLDERAARDAKRGLHQGYFQRPENWRKARK